MTVEVVNVIGDFDITLPRNGDTLVEGDDHIRNLKIGVLGSFAGKMDTPISTTDDQFNFSNTLTSDIQAQLDALTQAIVDNGSVPIGGIIAYNGAFSSIAANFQLCDGTNGTPDLADQFIFGTNTEVQIGDTGGSADAIVVSHDHPANHGHTGSAAAVAAHSDHTIELVDQQGDPGLNTRIATTTSDLDAIIAGGLIGDGGAHTPIITIDDTNFNTSSTGVSGTSANLPPYYKMAWIRRMS